MTQQQTDFLVIVGDDETSPEAIHAFQMASEAESRAEQECRENGYVCTIYEKRATIRMVPKPEWTKRKL